MNAMTQISIPHAVPAPEQEYLTFTIGNQRFGIPVLKVQDVLNARVLARIPLAPKEVAGSLNLRGRIVTAIDMHRRLDLPPPDGGRRSMNIVVEHEDELYSLIVDSVGDVQRLAAGTYESNPATLDPRWKDLSQGVHRLNGSLLIVLYVDRLLDLTHS